MQEVEDHFVEKYFGSRFICRFPDFNAAFAQQRTFNDHRRSHEHIDANEIPAAVFVGNEAFNKVVAILQHINASLNVLSKNVRSPA